VASEAPVVPEIKTVQDFGRALKAGPYSWPGGYPIFFYTEDGGALSFATAWNERANIAQAIVSGADPQWRIVGWDVNWEDAELYDDHTGNRIASAYADDDDPVVDLIPDSYHKWYRQTHGVATPQGVYKRGRKIGLDAVEPHETYVLPRTGWRVRISHGHTIGITKEPAFEILISPEQDTHNPPTRVLVSTVYGRLGAVEFAFDRILSTKSAKKAVMDELRRLIAFQDVTLQSSTKRGRKIGLDGLEQGFRSGFGPPVYDEGEVWVTADGGKAPTEAEALRYRDYDDPPPRRKFGWRVQLVGVDGRKRRLGGPFASLRDAQRWVIQQWEIFPDSGERIPEALLEEYWSRFDIPEHGEIGKEVKRGRKIGKEVKRGRKIGLDGWKGR
jgi:hypothetical protein